MRTGFFQQPNTVKSFILNLRTRRDPLPLNDARPTLSLICSKEEREGETPACSGCHSCPFGKRAFGWFAACSAPSLLARLVFADFECSLEMRYRRPPPGRSTRRRPVRFAC